MTRVAVAACVFVFFVWAFGRAIDAEARTGASGLSGQPAGSQATRPMHYQPGLHNVRHAINQAWCGRANNYCWAGAQAWRVAGCETGYTYSVWASNGQYLGLFQMGSYARARFGHGWNPWTQARAAYYYYVVSGRDWSPWTCKP